MEMNYDDILHMAISLCDELNVKDDALVSNIVDHLKNFIADQGIDITNIY
jgi:hypothetical protein